MSILQAIILGIIQGLTEFLPVSSSAHLHIVPFLLNWNIQSVSFDIVLHAGSLVAVLIALNKDIFSVLKSDIKLAKKRSFQKIVTPKLVVAVIPAIIVGYIFKEQLNNNSENILTTSIMLILVGIILLFVDKIALNNKDQKLTDISLKDALIIGVTQPLSFIRGVSRSGITISTAIFAGLSKEVAIKFSFLLSAILLIGGSILSIMQLHSGFIPETIPVLLAGFVASFISSLFAIIFLLKLIKKDIFFYFGVYRIILGVILLTLV